MEGKMRLTDRDIKILLKVNDCYWLSTMQLKRYFFPGTTLRAVNKRLKLLADQDYLFGQQPSRSEEYYFRLRNKGRNVLIEKANLNADDIRLPQKLPTQLKHFSTLNDLRWHCEQSILAIQGQLKFFFIDRELKSMFPGTRIIPDILSSFAIGRNNTKQRILIAIEYDAGTENPQYFGRDKLQSYAERTYHGHAPLGHEELIVLIFADTRKRIVQLIRHSMRYLDCQCSFFFGALEDLKERNSIFAEIYINPARKIGLNNKPMCSFLK
jgi:hypothetical protein